MSISESWDIDEREWLVSLRDWDKQRDLLLAARGGDRRRIDQSMKLGAHVNACDLQGQTPLMLAADCVESLIHTWGADVNVWTRRNDIYACRTPLAYAAEKGHHQCMDLLIQAGADVNATVNCRPLIMATAAFQCDSMRILIQAGADVNATDDCGTTCLLVACNHSYAECVELLIQQGADVNISDVNRNSALIVTVAHFVNGDTLQCLKLLLRAGAHVNRINCCGKNSLMYSTGREQINRQAMLLLLAAGETLKMPKTDGLPLKWDENHFNVDIPDHILYKTTHLELKHMCREAIRKHLLKLSAENLFIRAPRLELPTVLTSYIVYDMYLDL